MAGCADGDYASSLEATNTSGRLLPIPAGRPISPVSNGAVGNDPNQVIESNFIPAREEGATLGGATGILAGLVAVALPTGLVLGGGAVLAIALAGVGGLMSSLVGISIDSRRIEQFQAAMDQGEVLVMADVPWDRVEEIETLIQKHHPRAECEGIDTHTFP